MTLSGTSHPPEVETVVDHGRDRGQGKFCRACVPVVLLSVLSGCVSLPAEVERELAPPRACEPDNFHKSSQGETPGQVSPCPDAG